MKHLKGLVLVALGAAAAVIWGRLDLSEPQSSEVRVTGVYSDLSYSEQSGDMRGAEIIVLASTDAVYVVVQGAEGPLGCPVVAPAVVNGLNVEFTLPPEPCMFGVPPDSRFIGTVSAGGLRGRFEDYPDFELDLPRGRSYWQ